MIQDFPAHFKVFQIDLRTGNKTEVVVPAKQDYLGQLKACNRLNKDAWYYGFVYYVEAQT